VTAAGVSVLELDVLESEVAESDVPEPEALESELAGLEVLESEGVAVVLDEVVVEVAAVELLPEPAAPLPVSCESLRVEARLDDRVSATRTEAVVVERLVTPEAPSS
jgi:hypothetical protein